MRKKLANEKQQEVDDEDDRIAKAVAERESKREVSVHYFYSFPSSKVLAIVIRLCTYSDTSIRATPSGQLRQGELNGGFTV